MKRKIFTLLTLLTCVFGSAWGAPETVFSADVVATANVGFVTGTTEITASHATITGGKMYAISAQKDSKNLIGKQGSNYLFCMTNNDTYFKVELSKPLEAGDVISAKTYTRTDTNLGLFLSTATPRPSECDTKLSIAKVEKAAYEALSDYVVTVGDGLVGVSEFYIYRETGKSTYFNEFAIVRANSTEPTINASAATIEATETGVEATQNITVTGSNLTGSTLTATLSPSVPGLSVTLASNTIADGSISTTATLHYTATENARGETTLTLSDGTTSKDVTITYIANVVAWTLQTTSEATTWDFSKLTANSKSELYADEGIKRTDASEPKITDEFVYANYDGVLYTIGSGFDGTSIAFKGQYPTRRGSFCQNGTLKIKTAVPGTIVVKFSDTGSSASATAVKRYLQINGENTEYWTSRENNGDEAPYAKQLNVVTGAIPVEAGEITISGSSAITVYYVTFTPGTASMTITDAKWATFSSVYEVAIPEGVTAYYASASTPSSVTLTEIEGGYIPANTGVVVYSNVDATTVKNATYTSTDASLAGNLLKPWTVAGEPADATYYTLAVEDSKPVFKQSTGGVLAAGKAYLVLPAGAKTLSVVFDGETTGISDASRLNNAENANDKVVFNLNGQRIAAPQKGINIINGKKIIVK